MRTPLRLALAGLILILTPLAPAWASPDDAVSDEELREIERALGGEPQATPEGLACGEMKARVTADLAVGPYTLTFGPTEATMVGIVIEETDHGHDEEDDHQ
ncbi:MAG: hypothetical protein ACLGIN_09880 [Candidatus Sericytochromatia bacterium]